LIRQGRMKRARPPRRTSTPANSASGVAAVGLSQPSHGLGEVARLARLDHRHGQARGLPRTGPGLAAHRPAPPRSHHRWPPAPRPAASRPPPVPPVRVGLLSKRWASGWAPSSATSRCALATSMPATTEVTERVVKIPCS
jgi:hypothetical protein